MQRWHAESDNGQPWSQFNRNTAQRMAENQAAIDELDEAMQNADEPSSARGEHERSSGS